MLFYTQKLYILAAAKLSERKSTCACFCSRTDL